MTNEEYYEQEIERAYRALVRKLIRITAELEDMGQNDMGILHQRLAGRFHTATNKLRTLTVELTQDVAWPHEPGVAP